MESVSKWAVKIAAAALLLTAVVNCQTRRYKEFETVHGGMSKSEVLAAVGGPQRTQRWQGRDRWEYTLYGHPEGNLVREVHFENGVSTYVGPAIKPPVSASEQDRINDIKNHAADLRDFESSASEQSGFTVQRFEPVDNGRDTDGSTPGTKAGSETAP